MHRHHSLVVCSCTISVVHFFVSTCTSLSATPIMTIKECDILLLGKTGNGKSSAGNSILKRQVFETSGSVKSATLNIDFSSREYKDNNIQVVDSQGYGDTRLKSQNQLEEFSKCLSNAMKANDGKGFHVFALVMKYGNRLTKEEQDAFNAVNRIFPGVMSTHGILLITNGDTFKHDEKKSGITFEQWCQDQDESFQELVKQFGGRVVLFNNLTEDEAEQDAQLDKLLKLVETLPSGGLRYSNTLFAASAAELKNSHERSNEDFIESSFMNSTSALMDQFDSCKRRELLNDGSVGNVPILEWRKLLLRCDTLIESIEHREEGEMVDVKTRLVRLKFTIVEYIEIIKQSQNEEKDDKFQNMQAAEKNVREKYFIMKAKKIALIVGTVIAVGVLAWIIVMLIRSPATLPLIVSLSRALYTLITKSRASIMLIPMLSIPASVFVILKQRQALTKKCK